VRFSIQLNLQEKIMSKKKVGRIVAYAVRDKITKTMLRYQGPADLVGTLYLPKIAFPDGNFPDRIKVILRAA
jgi:hypothetical protein